MRRKLMGRHPLTIGAAILLGLSVYELWVRLEDFQAWFLGVQHLSQVRGTSFFEDLGIIFEVPQMRQMGFKMIYLVAVVIFAIVCLVCRNKSKGMWVLMILALAAAGAGIALEIYALSGWVQIIKLIPLALIVIGSISNMASRGRRRGPGQKELPESERRRYLPQGNDQRRLSPPESRRKRSSQESGRRRLSSPEYEQLPPRTEHRSSGR